MRRRGPGSREAGSAEKAGRPGVLGRRGAGCQEAGSTGMPGGAGETGLKVTSWRLGRTRPDEAWIPGGENEAVAVVDCKFGLAKVRGSSL